MDPSPRDHPSTHVLKKETKWIRSRGILLTRGHITVVSSPTDGQRVKLASASDLHQITIDIERLAFFREEPRLTRNRGPIIARSWPNRPTIVADRHVRSHIYASSTIAARSPCNQSPIVARLCPRSGLIQRQSGEDSSWD